MNTKLNKSDFLILALYFGVATLVWIVDYMDHQFALRDMLVDIPVVILSSFLTVIILAQYIFPKYLFGDDRSFFWLLVYTLIIIICTGLLRRFIQAYTSDWLDIFWEGFPLFLLKDTIIDTAQNIGFPLGLLLAKKYFDSLLQLQRAQQVQRENELKLLRSQVNPHFLFNNLNTLDALIATNPQRARSFISRLSSIYRYLIRTKDAEVMELAKELKHAEDYIFLIETRFGDDYRFTIENEVNLESKFLPTGALQTVIENVTKHNRIVNGQAIMTTIRISNDQISIANNRSTLLITREASGTGLQNLRERYDLLGDRNIHIHQDEHQFVVHLPILNLTQ